MALNVPQVHTPPQMGSPKDSTRQQQTGTDHNNGLIQLLSEAIGTRTHSGEQSETGQLRHRVGIESPAQGIVGTGLESTDFPCLPHQPTPLANSQAAWSAGAGLGSTAG
jgi:hypothetical protein